MVRAIVHQPDRKQVATTMLDSRISALYSEVSDLVDIDKSSQELIKRVDEDGKSTDLRVVSIYGFGGLGKTTLADQAYRKLQDHFDCRAFLSVSQEPDIKKILSNLLSKLRKLEEEPSCDSCELHDLLDDLRNRLQDKR